MRKTGTIKPKTTILLLVEGSTEKIYFNQLKSFERFQNITIKPQFTEPVNNA
jgi:hypothetical protein